MVLIQTYKINNNNNNNTSNHSKINIIKLTYTIQTITHTFNNSTNHNITKPNYNSNQSINSNSSNNIIIRNNNTIRTTTTSNNSIIWIKVNIMIKKINFISSNINFNYSNNNNNINNNNNKDINSNTLMKISMWKITICIIDLFILYYYKNCQFY